MARRKPPKGYDSKFEQDLHKGPLKKSDYHCDKIAYVTESIYEPDFRWKDILIEAKGRFRDRKEAAKYVWVRRALMFEELVFVFYNPLTPMPGAQRRKDGTKMTHAEWAEKNGFRWFTKETIKEIIC